MLGLYELAAALHSGKGQISNDQRALMDASRKQKQRGHSLREDLLGNKRRKSSREHDNWRELATGRLAVHTAIVLLQYCNTAPMHIREHMPSSLSLRQQQHRIPDDKPNPDKARKLAIHSRAYPHSVKRSTRLRGTPRPYRTFSAISNPNRRSSDRPCPKTMS